MNVPLLVYKSRMNAEAGGEVEDEEGEESRRNAQCRSAISGQSMTRSQWRLRPRVMMGSVMMKCSASPVGSPESCKGMSLAQATGVGCWRSDLSSSVSHSSVAAVTEVGVDDSASSTANVQTSSELSISFSSYFFSSNLFVNFFIFLGLFCVSKKLEGLVVGMLYRHVRGMSHMMVATTTMAALRPHLSSSSCNDPSIMFEMNAGEGAKPFVKGTRALSWKEAAFVVQSKRLELLGRGPEAEALYQSELQKMVGKYASVKDYIFHTKFGCRVSPAPSSGGRLEAESPLLPRYAHRFPALLPNDFPYFFDPEVSHWVLWDAGPLSHEAIDGHLQRHVPPLVRKDAAVSTEDYVFWVNPEALKSIPEVWHAHVLIRTCQQERPSQPKK